MKCCVYVVALLVLLSGSVSHAQQQDGEIKTNAEEVLEEDVEKNEEALPRPPPPPPPPPPKPSNKVFKPSTEISDDSAVAFPVDI